MNRKKVMEEEKEEFAGKHYNSHNNVYLDTKYNNSTLNQKSSMIQFYLITIVIVFLIYYFFSHQLIKL